MFYDFAISWGISLSDFWQMTPQEWWRIYNMKRPKDPKMDYAGNLKQSDVDRLERMMRNGHKRSR